MFRKKVSQSGLVFFLSSEELDRLSSSGFVEHFVASTEFRSFRLCASLFCV